MNIKINIRHAVIAVVLLLASLSCSSVQTGIRQVQLGMSKHEVTDKVKNVYELVSMVQTPQGGLEIIRFSDWVNRDGKPFIKGYYQLHFLDDKLVELNYEDVFVHPFRPH